MRSWGIALCMGALLLQGPAALTASLDKDTCAKLKTEQGQLEEAGVRGSMAKGPDWAKTNLAPDKLEQIKRLIEVEEQLVFRCQGRPLVVLPPEAELDPAAKAAQPREDGEEPPAKVPAAKAGKAPGGDKKKAAAKKPDQTKDAAPGAAKQGAPAKKEPATRKAAAPAKAEKAKPKEQVDDAYRPPAGQQDANPFAGQLAPATKN